MPLFRASSSHPHLDGERARVPKRGLALVIARVVVILAAITFAGGAVGADSASAAPGHRDGGVTPDLPGAKSASSPSSAAPVPAPPSIDIQLRGPLALVEIDRPVRLGREYGSRAVDEVVLDLALPTGARLARAELHGAGAPLRLRPASAATARAGYAAGVQLRQWRRASVPAQADEGADLRLAVAAEGLSSGAEPEALRLRLRFVAPLACRGGDLVLGFPAALDANPADARVTVRLDPGPGAVLATQIEVGSVHFAHARPVVRAQVGTGNPWQITLKLVPTNGSRSRTGTLLVSRAGNAVVANLCRAPAVTRAAHAQAAGAAGPGAPGGPGRVLFLLDRSRSMGPGGASAAGALARAVALGLPPGARFAAVLFDREATALFPVFRTPTLEALGALESAIEAGSLRNGSNLVAALRRGEQLLAGDAAEPVVGGHRAPLVVLITDGALPDDEGRAALEQALQGPGMAQAQMAVLILRGPNEEAPAPFAVRALGALPARKGGLLRQIDPVGAAEQAPALIAALLAGGDLVELEAGGGLGTGRFDRIAVPPGQGALWLGKLRSAPAGASLDGASPPAVVVRASLAGKPVRWDAPAPFDLATADPGWAAAVAALATAPADLPAYSASAADGRRLALLTPPPEDPTIRGSRGRLDRDVVHSALAYAYLPRARACYLTRAVKTAADFQLRGRLRLELRIERGEMMDAVVARSTLGRPEIERCLREAAFSVDVPRPVMADVPAIAALNLVFRPRTEATSADAGVPGELDRSTAQTVDKLLGPRGPASDPMELLIEDDARPPPAVRP
jgi:hypothetical protein